MLEDFHDVLVGIHYVVCTYSRGNSDGRAGYYKAQIYELNGSSIQDARSIVGDDPEASAPRLELLAIETALREIGPTEFPIACVTRQEYIPKYIGDLRKDDFRKSDGREYANADVWRRIAALDPTQKVTWHYVARDLDDEIAEHLDQQDQLQWALRAIERDRS